MLLRTMFIISTTSNMNSNIIFVKIYIHSYIHAYMTCIIASHLLLFAFENINI